jgi:hypothetical protein
VGNVDFGDAKQSVLVTSQNQHSIHSVGGKVGLTMVWQPSCRSSSGGSEI